MSVFLNKFTFSMLIGFKFIKKCISLSKVRLEKLVISITSFAVGE